MILPSPVISAMEVALNNALLLDSDSFEKVTQLAGKIIKIDLHLVDIQFYLAPTADGIQVLGECEQDADTTILGTPLSLLRTALTNDRQTLLQGDVNIEGDTDLGQKFQKILNNIEPDWEEPIAKVFGDVAGHQIGEVIRGFGQFAKNTFISLSMSTSEYYQDESRDIVTSTEAERFADSVDNVRSDVERMELRIERLRQTIREQSS